MQPTPKYDALTSQCCSVERARSGSLSDLGSVRVDPLIALLEELNTERHLRFPTELGAEGQPAFSRYWARRNAVGIRERSRRISAEKRNNPEKWYPSQ